MMIELDSTSEHLYNQLNIKNKSDGFFICCKGCTTGGFEVLLCESGPIIIVYLCE